MKKFLRAFIFIFVLMFFIKFAFFDNNIRLKRFISAHKENTFTTNFNYSDDQKQIFDNNISSKSAIVINLNTKEIIYSKNPDEKIYPASLTKIMTTIIGIEEYDNINELVTIPNNIFDNLSSTHASIAGFKALDNVLYKDLLYGAMLPSGADATSSIEYFISKDEANFVKLMNKKAKKLKMKNSHFSNSSGLHNNKNYSTVEDLAKLLSYSLNDGDFKAIFTKNKHTTYNGLVLKSSFFNSVENNSISNNYILGAKTGFTPEAGLCLATYGIKNNNEYITITANALGNNHLENTHILDNIYLYNEVIK